MPACLGSGEKLLAGFQMNGFLLCPHMLKRERVAGISSKMVMITLYVRQQKRYRCIEQSFGPCGRGRGWDDLGEWHWNMYNIYETNRQSRFDVWYWMLVAGALRWPRGMVRGGRREGSSGWGTCVYLWRIHVDVWQNQYNTVK